MPLRLGLLSTAKINGEILRGAAGTTAVEVVAVASRDRGRAESYAAETGLERAHGSYEELLADPDVDAVYIPLPNALHVPWAVKALEAGKHVLCEKPFSRRPEEAAAAFDLAAERGLVLAEAFMYRHHPQSARIVEVVRSGAIGRLRSIRAAFSFPLADAGNIRLLEELDGGALMDVGCYCVSGSRLLAGEPEHVQAEAVVGKTGVDLAFHGTMRFPRDVVAQFDASFVAVHRQWLEAVGDDAVLVVEAPWRQDWGGDVWIVNGRERERVEIPTADAYRLELEDFAAAARGERAPLLGREDALAQARTIEALTTAARERRPVELG